MWCSIQFSASEYAPKHSTCYFSGEINASTRNSNHRNTYAWNEERKWKEMWDIKEGGQHETCTRSAKHLICGAYERTSMTCVILPDFRLTVNLTFHRKADTFTRKHTSWSNDLLYLLHSIKLNRLLNFIELLNSAERNSTENWKLTTGLWLIWQLTSARRLINEGPRGPRRTRFASTSDQLLGEIELCFPNI